MTDKEIKELTTAYAEYACPESSYEEDVVERNMDLRIAKDEAEPVIKWLSDRFCIVSKEKINDWMEQTDLVPAFYMIDLVKIFKDLFGPDLFTDKDENHAD